MPTYDHRAQLTFIQIKLASQRSFFSSFNNSFLFRLWLSKIENNQTTLDHCAQRIQQAQEFLGQRILIENVSNYMVFKNSDRSEIDFIVELVDKADCHLVVDLNNIYVNHVNHGLNAQEYIKRLPLDRIKEIHLAGYEQKENFLLDAHNNPVSPAVWELYQQLIQRKSDIPTLIEWDNDIPSLDILLAEAAKAEVIMNNHKQ